MPQDPDAASLSCFVPTLNTTLTALSQISDFGLSAKMGLDETHIEGAHHGTLSHMAPEVLREGRQSKASDV